MFGNKNKQPKPKILDKEAQYNLVQQAKYEPVTGLQGSPQLSPSTVSKAQLDELITKYTNLEKYVENQQHIITEVASVVQSVKATQEGTKVDPRLEEMTDKKRLMVIEQNMLSHQTIIDSFVNITTKAITEMKQEINVLGQLNELFHKKKLESMREEQARKAFELSREEEPVDVEELE